MTPRRHLSQVNWRKIIDDFRSAYQLRDAWEIVLIELIANSIDAGATVIDLMIAGEVPKVLRVIDNGKGMTHSEFSQYHNLGSLTKERGVGIGWAGVGAKLYLDRSGSIYSETRSVSFEGASKWFLPRGAKGPVWDDVPSRALLSSGHGTAVEISVSDRKECRRISAEGARRIVYSHFNYALQPHGQVLLRLNGDHLVPYEPALSAESQKSAEIRLRNGTSARVSFFLMGAEVPEGFRLVSLVVHGKTIGDTYDFRQGARIREPQRISGFVHCDPLIRVVTTSKDSFNRKTNQWKDFDAKVGRAFSEWLREIGQLEATRVEDRHDALAKRVQSNLNRIFDLPEVRELEVDPFQSIARRRTSVADPGSGQFGREVFGQQMVRGTMEGPEEGNRVPVLGDEAGMSVLPDEHGTTKVSEQERSMRTGVKVSVISYPGRSEAAWMDFAEQAIVINDLHPAFRCADSTGASEFYIIETCFQVLSNLKEDEGERQAVLSKLFELYLSANPIQEKSG